MTSPPLSAGELCTRATVVARELDPRTLQAGDVTSTDPATVQEADSLLDALALMRRRGVRRVPVVDTRDGLQRRLSLDGAAAALGEQVAAGVQALSASAAQEAVRRP